MIAEGAPFAIAVAATLVTAIATPLLVAAERRASRTGRYLAKSTAAAGFVAVGLALAAGGRVAPPSYAVLVVVGLALGAAGDVGLMLPGRRAFTLGTLCFLAGHLAYVAAFAVLAPPAAWLGLHTAVAVVVAGVVLAWLLPHLSPQAIAPRPVVVAYVLVIVAMALVATSPFADGRRDARAILLAVGAVLFMISDLAVARHRFVAPSFWNKAWGQPTYFAAQLLIAWSLAG